MRAASSDAEALVGTVRIVWPDNTDEELKETILEYICSDESAVFAEKRDGEFIGAALCSLRHDYVEGCGTSPVGYLEGVSVREQYRRQGVAMRLVEECEQWAREKGCSEFASDCELDNTDSLNFHLKMGFEEENRLICFRKQL